MDGRDRTTRTTHLARRILAAVAALVAAVPALAAPTAAGAADWPTYHRDLARTGNDPATPTAVADNRAWTAVLDGAIYAEPVTIGNTVIAATENDTMYAFDVTSGALLWQNHVGAPVTAIAAIAGCGNIDPLGITGTPAIDAVSRTVYAAAEEVGSPVRHELVGINVDTGQEVLRRSLDGPLAQPGRNVVAAEQQRGALAVSANTVYVPFGGLAGDCNMYHGFVVGVPQTGSGGPTSYEGAPASVGGGIWAPSGMSLDGAGNVFVSTGNSTTTAAGSAIDDSESVVKLSPGLVKVDRFTPSTWLQDNANDQDLGSTAPAQLAGGTVFAVGKNGSAYLLNGSALGGLGGEQFQGRLCAAFGGTAYDGATVYVPCTDGVTAVRIDPGPAFHQLWKQPAATKPPIVAGGLVWSIGGATAYGLDPATGAISRRLALSSTPASFATPTAAQGRIVVAAGTHLDVFAPPTGTIAVEGVDAQLYVRHSTTGWLPLGGVLTGAPAAVGIPSGGGVADVYIVVGTDKALWERTDTAGWQHLSPAFTSCVDNPAAALLGSTLVVACQGADHAVWVGAATVDPGSGALPSISGLVSRGGATSSGPAAAVVNGVLTYFAVGTDNQLYQRTDALGWGALAGSSCIGHPAAGGAGPVSFAACHGADDALWYTVAAGGGWSGFSSLGGVLVDGPGIAASAGHVAFTVEGLGGQIYQNVAGAGATTGWFAANGVAVHGAGAAST